MNISEKKLKRLIQVAQLYYEQDKNQNEIADVLGVSRPMISRMLQEAKELGIVHIEVRSPLEPGNLPLAQLRNHFPVQDGVAVPSAGNNAGTNSAIARAAVQFLEGRGVRRLGLGWGSIIGAIAAELETQPPRKHITEEIFPLVGNLGVSNRNYHSNELVRVFAQQTMSQPHYLHAPAFFASEQELTQYKEFESFAEIHRLWGEMDAAVINIGNYPSTPDFATKARFGSLLAEKRAVGRLLSYYFTVEGEIIRSDTDYSLQAPLEALAVCRGVTAVCSSNVKPAALAGALRTGLINSLVASESLIQETLLLAQK